MRIRKQRPVATSASGTPKFNLCKKAADAYKNALSALKEQGSYIFDGHKFQKIEDSQISVYKGLGYNVITIQTYHPCLGFFEGRQDFSESIWFVADGEWMMLSVII